MWPVAVKQVILLGLEPTTFEWPLPWHTRLSVCLCRASGAMDNASDYGSEDSRFDSWLARAHDFQPGQPWPT